MNKRPRKKPAKQHASEVESRENPSSALQSAVEDFKDSATHLFETAWSELQQGTTAWVELLRSKAKELFTSLKSSAPAKPKTNSDDHARGQSSAA